MLVGGGASLKVWWYGRDCGGSKGLKFSRRWPHGAIGGTEVSRVSQITGRQWTIQSSGSNLSQFELHEFSMYFSGISRSHRWMFCIMTLKVRLTFQKRQIHWLGRFGQSWAVEELIGFPWCPASRKMFLLLLHFYCMIRNSVVYLCQSWALARNITIFYLYLTTRHLQKDFDKSWICKSCMFV